MFCFLHSAHEHNVTIVTQDYDQHCINVTIHTKIIMILMQHNTMHHHLQVSTSQDVLVRSDCSSDRSSLHYDARFIVPSSSLIKGQPTSAKGLGVPEDGGQEGELVEQAQGLPLHRGEGYGLLLHLWGVLGGGGAEVPQVEIYLKNAIFCSKNYFRP